MYTSREFYLLTFGPHKIGNDVIKYFSFLIQTICDEWQPLIVCKYEHLYKTTQHTRLMRMFCNF